MHLISSVPSRYIRNLACQNDVLGVRCRHHETQLFDLNTGNQLGTLKSKINVKMLAIGLPFIAQNGRDPDTEYDSIR